MSTVIDTLALHVHMPLVRCRRAVHFRAAVRRQRYRVLRLEVLILHDVSVVVLVMQELWVHVRVHGVGAFHVRIGGRH
jgi:hypothetical protein